MNTRAAYLRCITALLSACTLVCFAGPAAAQKRFQWKFSSGDRYRIDINQQLVQKVAFTDETVEIPSEITMTLGWRVAKVAEDGTAEIMQTVNQVAISMTVPGISANVQFDSSLKDEPSGAAAPLAEAIRPMIGVPYMQKMDVSGRIFEVEVPRDAFKGLESNPILKQILTGAAFKQLMTKASPLFPNDAIQKGHVWQNQTTQTGPVGTTTLENQISYDGERQKDGKTLDKFSVTLTMGIESNRNRGTNIKITEQDNQGTVWFDAAEGFLAESSLNQSVGVRVASGDTVVNQTVTSAMTVKVVKE